MTNIAPPTFIEFLKEIFYCEDDKYYGFYNPKLSHPYYNPSDFTMKIIKYEMKFSYMDLENRSFLKYYEENIAGKEYYISSDNYFYLIYKKDESGDAERIKFDVFTITRYFQENIGFGSGEPSEPAVPEFPIEGDEINYYQRFAEYCQENNIILRTNKQTGCKKKDLI